MQIFAKGLDALMSAIEDSASFSFDRELDEIGSSDVSCACRDAIRSLGLNADEIPANEFAIVRNYMRNCIGEIRARWN
jgi:hypothetical protein